MSNDYILITNHKEEDKKILIQVALNDKLDLFLINNQNGYHKLEISQLNEILKTKPPHRTHIFFKKPQCHNGRMEDFGDWTNAGIDDVLVKKVDADKILTEQKKTTLEKPLKEKERNTFYKMILAMAIDKYDFDTKSDNNKATGANTGSIKDSIQRILGDDLDEETIRNHLKEATRRFAPSQSKKT